jgi:hypothetical protein
MHVIDMQNPFMLPGVGFVEIKDRPRNRAQHQPTRGAFSALVQGSSELDAFLRRAASTHC